MSEERFVAIERRLTSVETKVDDLSREMRELHDDLRRHIAVLHDDTIDKLRARAPDFGPIRREFTAASAKLRDDIDQRLTPIEAAIRNRS